MRQTIGLGLAAAVAGPLLAVGAADRAMAATPAPGTARTAPRAAADGSTAARRQAGRSTARQSARQAARQSARSAPGCGLELVQGKRQALALRLRGLHRVYPAGGRWSGFSLTVGNRLAVPCRRVAPVVVFGARSRTLHRGDVQLQWRKAAGRWHPVALLDEAGVLAGKAGPAAGIGPAPGSRTTVPLRLRFGRSAPGGQWLTMAVGFAPVRLGGQLVPLPVGVSEPYLFRVEHAVRGERHGRPAQRTDRRAAQWTAHRADRWRPQLAGTGAAGVGPAALTALALLGAGAALLLAAGRGARRRGIGRGLRPGA